MGNFLFIFQKEGLKPLFSNYFVYYTIKIRFERNDISFEIITIEDIKE